MSESETAANGGEEQHDSIPDEFVGGTLDTNAMRRQGSASVIITIPQFVRSAKNINVGDVWEFCEGRGDPDEIVLRRTGINSKGYKGFDEEDGDEDE